LEHQKLEGDLLVNGGECAGNLPEQKRTQRVRPKKNYVKQQRGGSTKKVRALVTLNDMMTGWVNHKGVDARIGGEIGKQRRFESSRKLVSRKKETTIELKKGR